MRSAIRSPAIWQGRHSPDTKPISPRLRLDAAATLDRVATAPGETQERLRPVMRWTVRKLQDCHAQDTDTQRLRESSQGGPTQ